MTEIKDQINRNQAGKPIYNLTENTKKTLTAQIIIEKKLYSKKGLNSSVLLPVVYIVQLYAEFCVIHCFRSIYLVPRNLPNTFIDFQYCHFLGKLKITPPIT